MGTSYSTSAFTHAKPKAYFDALKAQIGEPSRGDDDKMVWSQSDLASRGFPFYSVVLRDEEVFAAEPEPHVEYLYTSVRLDVPRERVNAVLSLSDSLAYDHLQRELTSRGAFLGQNVVTLLLAVAVTQGHMTLDDASSRLAPGIVGAAKDPNFYAQMLENLSIGLEENQSRPATQQAPPPAAPHARAGNGNAPQRLPPRPQTQNDMVSPHRLEETERANANARRVANGDLGGSAFNGDAVRRATMEQQDMAGEQRNVRNAPEPVAMPAGGIDDASALLQGFQDVQGLTGNNSILDGGGLGSTFNNQ